MKDVKITIKKYYCEFCKKQLKNGSNNFCNDTACLDVRHELSHSIDFRDNLKIIDHGDGFVSHEPIDPNKLWKASKENKKIIEDRKKKYYEENND